MGEAIMDNTVANSTIPDDSLYSPKEVDPIRAAQERAGILAGLRRDRLDDARIQAVFQADPVVVEDKATGNLVTRRMLEARFAVFDAALEILGKPVLDTAARARITFTLRGAYSVLTDDAQVEWALSEVRREEIAAFLATRTDQESEALNRQVSVMAAQADLWAAARALSLAAHGEGGRARGAARLSELLEMREG